MPLPPGLEGSSAATRGGDSARPVGPRRGPPLHRQDGAAARPAAVTAALRMRLRACTNAHVRQGRDHHYSPSAGVRPHPTWRPAPRRMRDVARRSQDGAAVGPEGGRGCLRRGPAAERGPGAPRQDDPHRGGVGPQEGDRGQAQAGETELGTCCGPCRGLGPRPQPQRVA